MIFIRYSEKKDVLIRFFSLNVVFFLVLMLFFLILIQTSVVQGKDNTYVPTPPTGTDYGYVDIDYEYSIVTMNQNSSWMFDWGDGTSTAWLQLTAGQISITQTHHWHTAGSYFVRVRFKSAQISGGVWSNVLAVTISNYSSDDFPNQPVMNSGKSQGVIEHEYAYSVSTSDPHGNHLSYRFDGGNGVITEWTPYVASETETVFLFSWADAGMYQIRCQARNQYNLESSWSEPVSVTMRDTYGDDGTSINFVVLNHLSHQIMFTSDQNATFHNSSSGAASIVFWSGGGEYLLDDDGDGQVDYLYVPSQGTLRALPEIITQKDTNSHVPWLLIIAVIGIVLGVVLILWVSVKAGYIYMYEEVVVEE